jgi:hypothetical protein
VPASQFYDVVSKLDDGDRLVFVIKGQTMEGEDQRKTVAVQLGPRTSDRSNSVIDARKRLAEAGLTVTGFGEQLQTAAVRFGSRAAKARIEQGYEIVSVKGAKRPYQCLLVLFAGPGHRVSSLADAGLAGSQTRDASTSVK